MDRLLKHIVAELVSNESLYDQFYAELLAAWLSTKLPHKRSVILNVCSLENLVNLHRCLIGLKTLLDNIWREFELTEADEVAGYKVQNLVISFLVIELEDVLY